MLGLNCLSFICPYSSASYYIKLTEVQRHGDKHNQSKPRTKRRQEVYNSDDDINYSWCYVKQNVAAKRGNIYEWLQLHELVQSNLFLKIRIPTHLSLDF